MTKEKALFWNQEWQNETKILSYDVIRIQGSPKYSYLLTNLNNGSIQKEMPGIKKRLILVSDH